MALEIRPRRKVERILFLNGQKLILKSKLKYLDIFIVSSKKIKCYLQLNFSATILSSRKWHFGNIGLRAPHDLLLSLIKRNL